MLEADITQPSDSEWASPVCLVKKQEGNYQFCIDYRRVNVVSHKHVFPLPDICDALGSLLHSTPLTGRAIKPQRQGHIGGPIAQP